MAPAVPCHRRAALVALGTLALTGCGFQLRQAPKFAFDSLRLMGNETLPVSQALRRELALNGLRVVNGAQAAPVTLVVLLDQRERAVVGQTAAGQVRELQLRTRFRFRLQTGDERILIDDTELLLERDLSFNETQVLAKDAEELLLYRDMTNDIVQQVLRRIAAVDRV
ncbi:MAG: LPS assembly lipoprotein LptE [Hydrogenophaga sp.]|jgi:LPS-assembly lipoprotein|nr:LPS assembly lipoprotein LptE [Hydrogenophaga sp.]